MISPSANFAVSSAAPYVRPRRRAPVEFAPRTEANPVALVRGHAADRHVGAGHAVAGTPDEADTGIGDLPRTVAGDLAKPGPDEVDVPVRNRPGSAANPRHRRRRGCDIGPNSVGLDGRAGGCNRDFRRQKKKMKMNFKEAGQFRGQSCDHASCIARRCHARVQSGAGNGNGVPTPGEARIRNAGR